MEMGGAGEKNWEKNAGTKKCVKKVAGRWVISFIDIREIWGGTGIGSHTLMELVKNMT